MRSTLLPNHAPVILSLALALFLSLGAGNRSAGQGQVSNFSITGQYSPIIRLSAGTPPALGGRTAAVSNLSTGATIAAPAPDSESFAVAIDFGDLSRGDGNPVTAGFGLRVRSNTTFIVVAALSDVEVNGVRFQGREVTAADPRFINIWAGQITATGPAAMTPGQLGGPGLLATAVPISALPHGAATAGSPPIISGRAASIAGTALSPDNAIELPIFVSVPSGYDLGPAPGSAQASFRFTLQMAAFGAP